MQSFKRGKFGVLKKITLISLGALAFLGLTIFIFVGFDLPFFKKEKPVVRSTLTTQEKQLVSTHTSALEEEPASPSEPANDSEEEMIKFYKRNDEFYRQVYHTLDKEIQRAVENDHGFIDREKMAQYLRQRKSDQEFAQNAFGLVDQMNKILAKGNVNSNTEREGYPSYEGSLSTLGLLIKNKLKEKLSESLNSREDYKSAHSTKKDELDYLVDVVAHNQARMLQIFFQNPSLAKHVLQKQDEQNNRVLVEAIKKTPVTDLFCNVDQSIRKHGPEALALNSEKNKHISRLRVQIFFIDLMMGLAVESSEPNINMALNQLKAANRGTHAATELIEQLAPENKGSDQSLGLYQACE